MASAVAGSLTAAPAATGAAASLNGKFIYMQSHFIYLQSRRRHTHVLWWTQKVHYDTLDLEAMILHEIESVLGPLKYNSFFKMTSLELMENNGPINEKLLGLKAKKFFLWVHDCTSVFNALLY